jgi:metallo-beta-lactamase family protein
VELIFSGADREVTGSCHLVRVSGVTVALDCGLFQGKRGEADAKNRVLPLPVGELNAIVLSHAHIDHSGRLPFLAQEGYSNCIWATAATRDLCAYMLMDSARIQEKDAEFLERRNRPFAAPLYTTKDVPVVLEHMIGVPYHHRFDVVPGIRATFIDAGHILGSASVVLDCSENGKSRRLAFSGDIGRAGLPIIRNPELPKDVDVVVMESTYGNRDHEPVQDARQRLGEIVRTTAARGGRVLIPAFAVGRTQEILYDLHALVRAGQVPSLPIYVDSPLAIDATSVFELHPDAFDRSEDLVQQVQQLFRFELVSYTRDAEESKALNHLRGPMVIIAASGMAESGRILHHLFHGASDPRNTVLIVGFQAEHTLGRRIVERRPTIKVFGEEIPLRAQVEVLNGYSAHADRRELVAWAEGVRETSPRLHQVHLVHGEPAAQEGLSDLLRARGFAVNAPARGERAMF